jgi:hypothetical protein
VRSALLQRGADAAARTEELEVRFVRPVLLPSVPQLRVFAHPSARDVRFTVLDEQQRVCIVGRLGAVRGT